MRKLIAVLFAGAALTAAPAFRRIAHRGGIVDARFAESSPASAEAAIMAKYWMI